jgi:hypothetical protein
MNLQDFTKLEKTLGHPPTQAEVRKAEAEKQCPHCKRTNTRPDYDFPDTMRCCDDCGCDYIAEDGEIILDPSKII